MFTTLLSIHSLCLSVVLVIVTYKLMENHFRISSDFHKMLPLPKTMSLFTCLLFHVLECVPFLKCFQIGRLNHHAHRITMLF